MVAHVREESGVQHVPAMTIRLRSTAAVLGCLTLLSVMAVAPAVANAAPSPIQVTKSIDVASSAPPSVSPKLYDGQLPPATP